ncbi:MAG: hypothetical protein QOI80_1010 [Solirubrobacteraceae bacterium]|nr:hypothetical protein [Solirubrobacteraceae bacterium]
MARTECLIGAPPERVWEVLADPRHYGHWVVGSRRIRDADAEWPAVGSRFHHAVGKPPLVVRDHTIVEESTPPYHLKLRAKARPLGTAIVDLRLQRSPAGTHVAMTEVGGDRITKLLFMPLTHLLVWRRNVTSLERLKELAEGGGPSPAESASA